MVVGGSLVVIAKLPGLGGDFEFLREHGRGDVLLLTFLSDPAFLVRSGGCRLLVDEDSDSVAGETLLGDISAPCYSETLLDRMIEDIHELVESNIPGGVPSPVVGNLERSLGVVRDIGHAHQGNIVGRNDAHLIPETLRSIGLAFIFEGLRDLTEVSVHEGIESILPIW